jgi:hypothetical protein
MRRYALAALVALVATLPACDEENDSDAGEHWCGAVVQGDAALGDTLQIVFTGEWTGPDPCGGNGQVRMEFLRAYNLTDPGDDLDIVGRSVFPTSGRLRIATLCACGFSLVSAN